MDYDQNKTVKQQLLSFTVSVDIIVHCKLGLSTSASLLLTSSP